MECARVPEYPSNLNFFFFFLKAEDFVYVSFAILVECDITQIKLRL